MGNNACWLQNDNPYGKSYDNRGKPCKVYGATDFIVAYTVLGILGLALAFLLVGWVVRYSRNAARFSRFWNQAPVDDYELKQHRQTLLYGGNDDASSIRSRTTLAPPSTSTKNSRSPLSSYGGHEDVNPRDREYISTGYGDGGRGAAPDFPSGGSNQFYPGAAGAGRPGPPPGNQPWNNFQAGPPSTSQVNLHAGGRDDRGPPGGPRDERLGFLNQSAMSSVASFGGQDDRGVGGRLPDIDRYNPNQYSPQPQHGYANYPQSPQSPPGGPRPPQGGPRYGDPYGGR